MTAAAVRRMIVLLPARPPGRPSPAAEAAYQVELKRFTEAIVEIGSWLDFRVSSRGWCYILEEYGLGKGDFDAAERLINMCRKSGRLPLDICAEHGERAALHLDDADAGRNRSIEEQVEAELAYIKSARDDAIASAGRGYEPHGFWADQACYVEMLVEKVDLKELFRPVCEEFRIPLGNSRGWADINSRAAMMERFSKMEDLGKTCVLLYCGDHDPVGLKISDTLKSTLSELTPAVGWDASRLVIDRFGLNAEFIDKHKLTWIDGLETGSGRRLEDTRHPDHGRAYVREYLAKFGARKCEANALVVRPEAGRALCRRAIEKYVSPMAPQDYERTCTVAQQAVRRAVLRRLREGAT